MSGILEEILLKKENKYMKEFAKTVLKIIIGAAIILGLILLVISGMVKLINKIRVLPPPESAYQICLRDNKDKILEEIKNCVKDTQGNNVRCENSIKRIICP